MRHRHNRNRHIRSLFVVALCLSLVLTPAGLLAQDNKAPKPDQDNRARKANYELAARWTSQKVGKLVFDTSVTPHWLETGDRFWYSYETSQGKKFYIVDPLRKAKTPLFDNAKMAAMLTNLTRIPYDALHLPINTIKFVRKDSAFQFDVSVPRDADIPGAKKELQIDTRAEQGRSGEDKEQEDLEQAPEEQVMAAQDRAQREQPPQPRNRMLYFEYDPATAKLTLLEDFQPPRKPRWASISPDEKTVIFARGHNLFMMDAENYAKAQKKEDDASIAETQITTDGEEHFSYARRLTEEEKRQIRTGGKDKFPRVPAININWSKDSRKVAVNRIDQRKVADLWVINSLSQPRPTLETYRYAMPGEVNVPQSTLEVFDLASKTRVKVKADRFKDQTVAISTARVTPLERERARTLRVERGDQDQQQEQQQQQQRGPGGAQVEPKWLSDTSDKLYFSRTSRDMHRVDICVADAATGEVKTLIEERLNTYVETKPLWLVNNGQELIHWSERDGWGHYYLFDGGGALKNQITSGEFYCDEIEWIDEKARTIFFAANGREPGEDPYFDHFYRAGFDGGGLKLLDPGDGSHAALASDSGRYFVDNSSRVNCEPKSTLYDQLGNVVMELEKTDLAALAEAGFKFPEPFKVKADDGVTDLYGVMYKPFDFDPNRKYPIIAFVYPGPQTESVTKTFTPRNDRITLAQFGFIVIEVGNRGGNPQRSKWYHNYGYGNLRDYGLADKKAAIEQLARRNPFIDIDRVGIYGHSGGGFMSTAAMLVYPDFFKVAVSSSGNHENNVYNKNWSEKHHGVREVTDKDGNIKFEYDIEKNSELAKNLKGHLLLVTGDIDDNVHPANTLRMADALIKANKRFDFFIIPGKRHGYADATNYFFWIRADYFCRHLLGDAAESVDMIELNKEREQSGERGRGR
jgi:dipeptidyl aminopeptidase/acylaminoacyl peptidase